MNGNEVFERMLLPIAVLLGILILLVRLFLGNRGFQIFKAEFLVEVCKFIITAPFKLIAYLIKTVFEAYIRYKSQFVTAGTSFLQFLRKLI